MGLRLPRCIAATRSPVFANGLRTPGIVGLLQRRAFSAAPPPPSGSATGSQPGKPEVSKHIGFYKEFGQPISKVFLMSFFTYQALYWLWVKLEKKEEKKEKDEEVSRLLAEVERLQGAK